MKAMNFATLLSAAVIAVSGLGSPNSRRSQNKTLPHEPEAAKHQIVELERRWQRAVVNRDRAALENLLTKNFFEQEWISSGIERGDAVIRTIKRPAYLELVLVSALERYGISKDIGVELKDSATAIASLQLMVEPRSRIVPLSSREFRRGDYDIVDTWFKSVDGWHVHSRQARSARSAGIVPLSK